jgi:Ca-activated chloride channel homolog
MRSVVISRFSWELAVFLALGAPFLGQQQNAPTGSAQQSTTDQQPANLQINPDIPGPPRSTPPPSALATPDKGSADEGSFVFKKQVDEVVLHATVVDQDRKLAAHLDRTAFSVFEDGRPQTITSFRREDVPVAIGVVVDNSGSMRDKRDKVNQAVLNLIRASNPKDEVFVVNFSRTAYLDQDFTSDINLLEQALHQTTMQGSTALYDAVVASATHLENNPQLDKKILLVITDGQDNMSQNTLTEAMHALQKPNGPVVYAVGLTGAELQTPGREALQKLADATGGAAFFPTSLDQVGDVTRTLAHDIRSQYIIAYKPENEVAKAQYHPIQVQARAAGYAKLTVRTRSGVYTGESVR